jgi:hypothetical protein
MNDLWLTDAVIAIMVIVVFGVAIRIFSNDGFVTWLNAPDDEHPTDEHDNN